MSLSKSSSEQNKQPPNGPSVLPERLETLGGRVLLTFRMAPRALGLVFRAAPGLATLNLFFTVAQGISPAITLYLVKAIVDDTVIASRDHSSIATRHVILMIAFWFGVQSLSSLVTSFSSLVSSIEGDLTVKYVCVRLLEKSSSLDLQHFEQSAFYDTLENAKREATYRPAQMVNQIFGLFKNSVTLAAVIGVLASLSWWLVLLVLAVSIPSLIYQAKYSGRFFALLNRRTPEQRKLNYIGWLITTDVAVKELHVFGLQEALIRRYREIYDIFLEENRNLGVRRTSSQAIFGILGTIVMGLTYVYVVLGVIAGRITLGGLTLYYQAFQQSQAQILSILSGINSTYENSLFLSNIFTFFSYESQLPLPRDPLPMPISICEGIALEHVSFRYPNTEKWILKDVSFRINPGEIVALVGANGAGKTTLVKLLTRLYDPTEGRITIDGIDLRDFDLSALRSRIGVIFQDYLKYQLTASENIGFGCIEAIDDIQRIEQAAAAAGADAVVASLPESYQTPLGRWFQGGQELSIGQWQKIALARGFMRNADLLILDEPTSSLDAHSEYETFKAFGRMTENKMTILISHRFGTVRTASRIVVLENGRVVEDGRHDDLMLHGGRYAELFELQAASYR